MKNQVKSRRRGVVSWPSLYWGTVVCAVLFLVGMVLVNLYFSVLYNQKIDQETVQAIPEQAIPQAGAEPAYTGPHPAHLIRPKDPFPYPIPVGGTGPVESLFSGPLQYPFLCGVARSGLGQPLVDNQEHVGMPVYQVNPDTGKRTHVLVGYSKDCQVPTQIMYFYKPRGSDQFKRFIETSDDVDTIEWKGQTIPFVVRVEVGTINRFFYVLAAIKGPAEVLGNTDYVESPDTTYWNQRLIYRFRGGVGIGKRQGRVGVASLLNRDQALLEAGYALAYSTGNQTSNHYNLWLAEEVAMRVKHQFVARYGKPLRTLGMGGSGGAIQQLIIGQNNPDLLDGALALYAYPDMITQTIYAFDCELLEYYFDVTAGQEESWRQWKNRMAIQGLNAEDGYENSYTPYYNLARLVKGIWPPVAGGMSECVNAWRGLAPLVNNPHFTHLAKYYDPDVLRHSHWTHWDDLRHIYGVRESGYARQTWDNVGVQYGLLALRDGVISPDAFLHLNRHVGGWKPPEAFQQERYWKIVSGTSLFEFSPWSEHNMWQSKSNRTAPRTWGDREAIEAAFRSGHVFMGKIDLPVIDLRHYLEKRLDMHHLSASFSIRQRIQAFSGSADQHVMWVAEDPYKPIVEAMRSLDDWVAAREQYANRSVSAARPADLMDTCFDSLGHVVASGDDVWDGAWNGRAAGACMQAYPAYRTSRIVAGAGWEGDVFHCVRKSVDQALADGDYRPVDMTPYREALKMVFPDGVCDYRQMSNEKMAVLTELHQQDVHPTVGPVLKPFMANHASHPATRDSVAASRVE